MQYAGEAASKDRRRIVDKAAREFATVSRVTLATFVVAEVSQQRWTASANVQHQLDKRMQTMFTEDENVAIMEDMADRANTHIRERVRAAREEGYTDGHDVGYEAGREFRLWRLRT